LPGSPQQLALGTQQPAMPGGWAGAQLANPALLADSVSESLQASFIGYPSGAGAISAAYMRPHGAAGGWGFAVYRLGYGELPGYDAAGTPTGRFSASDALLQAGYAHRQGPYAWGIAAKWVQSSIGPYRSAALLFDAGGLFIHPKRDLRVGFSVRHLGFRLWRYASEGPFRAPVDVQAGISFKPPRMPLRLMAGLHHLHRFDIAYEDPRTQGLTNALGTLLEPPIGWADRLARHFSIGMAWELGKHFRLMGGYQVLRRRELAWPGRAGGAGLSWGLQLQGASWQACLAREAWYAGKWATAFSFSFRPGGLARKRRTVG
jgi:hypothetical protein